MIRITIDLDHSHGPHKDENLGSIAITNDGSGTSDTGNYRVRMRCAITGRIRDAVITDYDRTQHWSVLVAKALQVVSFGQMTKEDDVKKKRTKQDAQSKQRYGDNKQTVAMPSGKKRPLRVRVK